MDSRHKVQPGSARSRSAHRSPSTIWSSRRCCSIPIPTRSSTPIPPPAPCSATTARCCGETKVSALHAGQVPALIVFTQAVLDKGAYWTNALTPRHATGQTLRLEYAGLAAAA